MMWERRRKISPTSAWITARAPRRPSAISARSAIAAWLSSDTIPLLAPSANAEKRSSNPCTAAPPLRKPKSSPGPTASMAAARLLANCLSPAFAPPPFSASTISWPWASCASCAKRAFRFHAMFPSPALIISSLLNSALRRLPPSTFPASKLDTSSLTTFSATAAKSTTPAAKSLSIPNSSSALPPVSPPIPSNIFVCLQAGWLAMENSHPKAVQSQLSGLLPDAHEHRAVPRHLRPVLSVKRSHVLVQPQVPNMHSAGEPQILDTHFCRIRSRAAEKTNRYAAVRQRLGPNFQRAFRRQAVPLHAFRVLVHGNRFLVQQNRQIHGSHSSQIVPGQQWCGQQAPQCHVRDVFVAAHASVANFQHVRIIPMPRPRERFQPRLAESDLRHGLISVFNVAGRPPQIAANFWAPSPHQLPAVLAQTVDNRSPSSLQGIVHFFVDIPDLADGIDFGRAAPIVFQVIDSPCGIRLRILLFVLVTTLESGASPRPG